MGATRYGRYETLRMAGKGVNGQVYLAVDRELDRRVALKVFDPKVVGEGALRRFEEEAEILARAPAPGLVVILDVELQHDPPFVVLEWMPGGDLAAVLATAGDRSPEMVARVGARVARALEGLHAQGILHRDIKAENILFDEMGEPALADLGLARWVEGEGLTRTGHIVGTPLYMPPETVERGEYSPASDLYALGLTLAELATGRRLRRPSVVGNEAMDLVGEVRDTALRKVLRRCIQSEPERRYPDARVLAEDLEDIALPLSGAGDRPGGRSVSARPLRTGANLQPGGGLLRRMVPGLAALGFFAAGIVATRRPPAASPDLVPADPGVGVSAAPAPIDRRVEAATLRRALDEALRDTWSGDGVRGDPDGPHDLVDAVVLFGITVLEDLPALARVLAHLDGGADVAAFPREDRAALAELDADFRDLDLPPPFRPFLEAAPRSPPASLPALPESLDPARLPPLPPRHSAAPWWESCLALLGEAHVLRADLEARYRRGELGIDPALVPTRRIAVFGGQSPENLDVFAGSLRSTGEGRAILRQLLPAGREVVRDFLVAAHRVAETPDLPDARARVEYLEAALTHIDGFFMGSFLAASRVQLFGTAARTPAGLDLEARVLRELDRLRERSIGGRRPPPPDAAELWKRGREAALATGHDALAARLWNEQLRELHRNSAHGDFLAGYARYQARLRKYLDREDRETLARFLTRAMLDVSPVADPGR